MKRELKALQQVCAVLLLLLLLLLNRMLYMTVHVVGIDTQKVMEQEQALTSQQVHHVHVQCHVCTCIYMYI